MPRGCLFCAAPVSHTTPPKPSCRRQRQDARRDAITVPLDPCRRGRDNFLLTPGEVCRAAVSFALRPYRIQRRQTASPQAAARRAPDAVTVPLDQCRRGRDNFLLTPGEVCRADVSFALRPYRMQRRHNRIAAGSGKTRAAMRCARCLRKHLPAKGASAIRQDDDRRRAFAAFAGGSRVF